MLTIHAADARSHALAVEIAKRLVAQPTNYTLRRGFELDVRKPRGDANEMVLVAGVVSDKQKRSRHYLAMSFDVTRDGKTRRIHVENTLASRRSPTLRERLASLARPAAHQLAPYFKRTTKKAAMRRIHVDAYYAQHEPVFRNRILARLRALGFRARVTLGFSDAKPDAACWGYLRLPFVRVRTAALSRAVAVAGGHAAKTMIRVKVDPDRSEDVTRKLLADKLADWYAKLASIA